MVKESRFLVTFKTSLSRIDAGIEVLEAFPPRKLVLLKSVLIWAPSKTSIFLHGKRRFWLAIYHSHPIRHTCVPPRLCRRCIRSLCPWKEVFHPPFAVSISRDVSICCDRPPQRSRRKERAEGRTDRTKRLSGDGAAKPACPCRGRGRTNAQAYPGFSGPIDPDFLKDGSCSLFSRLDTRE